MQKPRPEGSPPSRYGGIYGVMLRNSLIREMSFQLNFLLWMLV